MAETSKIEWTDATWNPITGCTLVSEGCRHCYAARLAATRMKHHPSREGLARINAAGDAKFTGEVRFNEDWLDQPLRWRKPRRIFVCAHGDLFHESVPDDWIDRVFAVMALAPQHTFQVLTKRPERARQYLTQEIGDGKIDPRNRIAWDACVNALQRVAPKWKSEPFDGYWRQRGIGATTNWPPPNVWLGTSVEDQATADARIPHLLATPAAVRFVSAEPLLGPVDLMSGGEDGAFDYLRGFDALGAGRHTYGLDWLIVGGESGPQARPMHPEWARTLRDQCRAAGVAFHFKQWGEWKPCCHIDDTEDESLYHPPPAGNEDASRRCRVDSMCLHVDGEHIPTGAAGRLHDIPNGAFRGPRPVSAFKIGKSRAGRTLDGRTWDEMPEATG